jgi:hypothetical protein
MTTLKVIQTTEVEDYVLQLADRLEAQYKEYHIRMISNYTSDYANKQMESIKNGTANFMRFNVIEGRKYWKIFSYEYDDRLEEYKQGSINAFVNKQTGEVFKPASYNKPAKHVRYNLLDENSRANCLLKADWAGGYLYIR